LAKKKAAKLPPLRDTLVAPDPDDPDATIMELDELHSFVLKKSHTMWIWIALCRKTRQIIARAVGDRSKATCLELWNNIPEEYRNGHCFADFWKVYQLVIRSAISSHK
jgi:insertion element IS1 protein InsB